MNNFNQPKRFNFLTHYRGDGLPPYIITLRLNGDPVDLTDSNISLQMKPDNVSQAVFEFNSDGSGDALFTISDALNGVFHFPLILNWEIPADNYNYDLQVIDKNGYTRTYMRGKWRVNQDITILK